MAQCENTPTTDLKLYMASVCRTDKITEITDIGLAPWTESQKSKLY